ncbi:hypothetical protein J6590_029564 [Homalodisca vitripennis]|nr:hypothetical protein J6590_029564 [Homalodisca vitripennis]
MTLMCLLSQALVHLALCVAHVRLKIFKKVTLYFFSPGISDSDFETMQRVRFELLCRRLSAEHDSRCQELGLRQR